MSLRAASRTVSPAHCTLAARVHAEFNSKKPRSWYKLYGKGGFLCLISACRRIALTTRSRCSRSSSLLTPYAHVSTSITRDTRRASA
eukprot:3076080-Rhodomonas_salina.1